MSDSAGNGFSVLDGVALVAGAAVASVHTRGVLDEDPFGPGWLVVLVAFIWVAMTAAGPFLYLVRRYVRALPGYPQVGDRLWAILGLPWLLTALIQAAPSRPHPATAIPGAAHAALLMVGLGVASLTVLSVVWGTWVTVTPEQASETFSPPWTNRVGLVLSIAWPVQCGVGMVVIGR
jgi:hypothetical protein